MKFASPIVVFLPFLFAYEASGFVVGKSKNFKSLISETTSVYSTVQDEVKEIESTVKDAAELERIAALPLPPSRKPGPFRGLRESISHMSNGKRFVRKRAEELGGVFLSTVFFQPTVVIGGQEAVKEFVSGSELKNQVIHPGLPETFTELHTKWGALNLDANDELFKEARLLFSDVFSRTSLEEYTGIIDNEMDLYIQELKKRILANPNDEIFLVQELEELSLQIFSKIFSGEGLSEEHSQMFRDYNAALLALPFEKKKFEKGQFALKALKEEMLARYKKSKTAGSETAGHYYFQLLEGREGFDNDDRICSGMVLFVWGAYVECTALMVDSLVTINEYDPGHAEIVLEEFQAQESREDLSSSDLAFWSGLNYNLGVLRETLRLVPPGGGTPRYSKEDFEFRGYRIPAGTSVILDPRIGNTDPNLFVNPEEFKPSRWVKESSKLSTSKCPLQGTALKLGFGSWFPGGFGAHQCPGVPLAELTSKMFLAKTVKEFDSWSFGSGTDRNGKVKYEEVPVKIPVSNLGVTFSLR